mmetsp:Transcript_72338/g.127509  ORF Transcript_72338/g.127509 Transcript_72338/m.127509 type:complete len:135 (-) Transcript_72338:446-850(-)
MEEAIWDELVAQLTDDKFLDFVGRFTTDHCVSFYGKSEYSLEHTELHEKYKRLYESRMEALLKKRGWSFDQFIIHSEELLQKDPEVHGALLDYIMAIDDFTCFAKMMHQKHLTLLMQPDADEDQVDADDGDDDE